MAMETLESLQSIHSIATNAGCMPEVNRKTLFAEDNLLTIGHRNDAGTDLKAIIVKEGAMQVVGRDLSPAFLFPYVPCC